MSQCPNCQIPLIGKRCTECGISWNTTSNWTCPECGTEYSIPGSNRGLNPCPNCKAIKDAAEKAYWDEKRAGMRSITDDIVAQALARIEREG